MGIEVSCSDLAAACTATVGGMGLTEATQVGVAPVVFGVRMQPHRHSHSRTPPVDSRVGKVKSEVIYSCRVLISNPFPRREAVVVNVGVASERHGTPPVEEL